MNLKSRTAIRPVQRTELWLAWIEQKTNALSDPAWRYFKFRYTFEIDDPLNSPNTRLG